MVAYRSAVDLQPSINFQTPVENLGPLLETPGTTIPVGTGGLHFISGARRGMNELRLQGRPTVQICHFNPAPRGNINTKWQIKTLNEDLDGESGLCHVVGPVHDIRLMNSLSCLITESPKREVGLGLVLVTVTEGR